MSLFTMLCIKSPGPICLIVASLSCMHFSKQRLSCILKICAFNCFQFMSQWKKIEKKESKKASHRPGEDTHISDKELTYIYRERARERENSYKSK